LTKITGQKFRTSPKFYLTPVSSTISDLCEISDLLLFFGYFTSQNKETKSGN